MTSASMVLENEQQKSEDTYEWQRNQSDDTTSDDTTSNGSN